VVATVVVEVFSELVDSGKIFLLHGIFNYAEHFYEYSYSTLACSYEEVSGTFVKKKQQIKKYG